MRRRSPVSSALASGALALGLVAAASSAQAVVVYSGTVNLNIPNTFDGLFLNVLTGSSFTGPGFPTLTGAGANYDINLFGTSAWSLFSPGSSGQSAPTPVPATSKGYVAATSTGGALNLALGSPIDGTSVFNTSAPSAASLATGTPALLGFRFRNEGDVSTPADDTVHFGWARVLLTSGAPGTLIDYAFESSPLTAIQAGVVPEPSSYAMFGAGALALLAWSRRRQRQG
jgi:PEP-CTERM motif